MSGLYVLLVLGIWAGLTALIVRGWRRLLARGDVPKLRVHAVFVPVLLCWLGVTFWYGGGRKVYYDAEVNRMCREDGGVKVYETVKLPAERFDKYGVVRIPSRQDAKLGDEYYYEWNVHHYRHGEPSIRRDHFLIVRRSDAKLLGESISYARRGGDTPGPWHPSSFRCPADSGNSALQQRIFTQSKGE